MRGEFYAERTVIGSAVGWHVYHRRVGSHRCIASVVSGVLAKRIANALNIYVPKSRRAKALRG